MSRIVGAEAEKRLRNRLLSTRKAPGAAFGNREVFLSIDEQTALWAALRLSTREAQIVVLMLLQHSDIDIAEVLNISAHTVHSHVERIYRKLAVHSRCELIVTLFKTYISLRFRQIG